MSIRQRLYPDPQAVPMLTRHCADARFVWNLGLEQREMWKRERTAKVNTATQMRELTEARRAFEWLGNGSVMVQQQALRDLDQAYQNWWSNPGHFGHPTWRKAVLHEGFRIVALITRPVSRKWGEVHIPKVGYVRFRLTRQWSEIEAAKSARVTLDRAGRWHVSFTSPAPAFARVPSGAVVGLDMGVAASVTTSDGEHLRMPALLTKGETQRKRRLQRQMSRQVKGSNRRTTTRLAFAKLAARESARRKDWIEQTTTRLVRDYDSIVMENLAVKNMVRSARGTMDKPGKNVRAKAALNRSIHGQAWALFRKRITDKATAATSPVEFVAVNPAFTSQRCSSCGHTAKENRESQAAFICRSCGHSDNADVNAARNILAAGQAVTGRGGTPRVSGPTKRQPPVGAAA